MFTKKDIECIDLNYFEVLSAGCYSVAIKSRNTGHCWFILHQEYPKFKTCTIYHTHREGTPYHKHGHGRTLESCIHQIQSHDDYQLRKDAMKRRIARDKRRHRRNLEADSLISKF